MKVGVTQTLPDLVRAGCNYFRPAPGPNVRCVVLVKFYGTTRGSTAMLAIVARRGVGVVQCAQFGHRALRPQGVRSCSCSMRLLPPAPAPWGTALPTCVLLPPG